MARLTPQSSTAPAGGQRPISSMIALAGWHWRRQRPLFLLMNLGMIALVFLACLVPAQTEMAPTAALHLRFDMARLPLMSISLQGVVLLLFFLHLMARALVERQADTLAVLHHQGASTQQILGSLLLQSIVVALIACLAGPLLAYWTAISLFPERHRLTALWHDLSSLLPHLWPYAACAALLALGIIIATLYFTIHKTMPAHPSTMYGRGDPPFGGHSGSSSPVASPASPAAPSSSPVALEILVALIALAAYILLLALFQPRDNTVPPQFPLLAPLAPTLLLAGLLPLCLRGTALLTRLGILMMQPGYMMAPTLAVLHTIRPARVLSRMTLLLTLTTAFTLFALIFATSQERRINDIAASSIGADFSGTLTEAAPPSYLTPVARLYQRMPGILSVTVGAVTSATGNDTSRAPIQIQAVDAATFAQTASWPQQNTVLSLSQMMQLLIDERPMASAYHVVPVIVDDTTARLLSLRPGTPFTLYDPNGPDKVAHYLVLASIPHIPGSNNGILVDYQSLTDYQARNGLAVQPINHVWLHTSSDEASLKHVRKTITTSLRLDNLFDRRFLLASLQSDPLVLAVQSILIIGAVIALLLAVLGNILAFRVSNTTREVHRGLLHALETEPGHVASLLIWEQAWAYLLALLSGLLIGLLLAFTLIPILLNHIPLRSVASPDAMWYTSQQLLSAQIVIPAPLGIALGFVLLLIPPALILLLRMLSRPALYHILQVTDQYQV